MPFIDFTFTIWAQGFQQPLQIFSTQLISGAWAESENVGERFLYFRYMSIKYGTNSRKIQDVCSKKIRKKTMTFHTVTVFCLLNYLGPGRLFLEYDPWIIYDPSGPKGLNSSL